MAAGLEHESIILHNWAELSSIVGLWDHSTSPRAIERVRAICESLSAKKDPIYESCMATRTNRATMLDSLISTYPITIEPAWKHIIAEVHSLGMLEHIAETRGDQFTPLFNSAGSDLARKGVDWTRARLLNAMRQLGINDDTYARDLEDVDEYRSYLSNDSRDITPHLDELLDHINDIRDTSTNESLYHIICQYGNDADVLYAYERGAQSDWVTLCVFKEIMQRPSIVQRHDIMLESLSSTELDENKWSIALKHFDQFEAIIRDNLPRVIDDLYPTIMLLDHNKLSQQAREYLAEVSAGSGISFITGIMTDNFDVNNIDHNDLISSLFSSRNIFDLERIMSMCSGLADNIAINAIDYLIEMRNMPYATIFTRRDNYAILAGIMRACMHR